MTTQNSTPVSFFYRGFVLETENGACVAYRAGEPFGRFETTDAAKMWVDAHPIVAQIERRKKAKAMTAQPFDAETRTAGEIREHVENVAGFFNLSVIKLQTHYAGNLAELRADLARARKTGRKVRGYSAEQLEKLVRNFEALVHA